MSALATPDTSDRLAELASKIDRHHVAAQMAAHAAIDRALECGRHLVDAKKLVGHGDWLPWLATNTSVGARQAQKYMKLARGWAKIEAKCEPGSYLTMKTALGVLADPAPPPNATDEHPYLSAADSGILDSIMWFLDQLAKCPEIDLWSIAALPGYWVDGIPECLVEIGPSSTAGYVHVTALVRGEVCGTPRPVRPWAVAMILATYGVPIAALEWHVGEPRGAGLRDILFDTDARA